jgi:hypothetical protein
MSFDLDVLAADPGSADAQVRAMVERCRSLNHPDGELDPRIVRFYEILRARYPDFPPYGDDSPWMMTPLSVGIDHVTMHISFSGRGARAVEFIDQLARQCGLTIYDPQGDAITRPADVRTPVDPAMRLLIEELGSPDR